MALLTIAIPTFNRAEALDHQLRSLSQELAGHESTCEILVSDNASTDHTVAVLEAWRRRFAGRIRFRFVSNADNCGVMHNIAVCLTEPSTPHVWVLGDDDELSPGIVSTILDELRAEPDLHLLCLNYSMYRATSGEIMTPHRYDLDGDLTKVGPGPLTATDRTGEPILLGLGFMSALIYRTATARQAIASWDDFDNLEIQIYWSGFCAAAGTTRILCDVHLRYACGDNVLARPRNWYKVRNHDAPEVYTQLLRIGYDRTFMIPLILHPLVVPHELKALVTGFWRWPSLGVASLASLTSGAMAIRRARDREQLLTAPPAPCR